MDTVAALPKYNLSEEQEKKLILREYRALLRSMKPKLKPGDKELVRMAFEMAADAHKTTRRKSGEPYILHPLAVARICVEEIGLGVRSTICSKFSSAFSSFSRIGLINSLMYLDLSRLVSDNFLAISL